MNKEKLKSLLLTVLVVTSIVLTQRVWFNSPLQIISSEASYLGEKEAELLQARNQVVRPERIIAGFGGGPENSHFSILTPPDLERFWLELQVILKDHFLSDSTVRNLSMEEYQRIRAGRSIEMHFAKGFPTALLSTLFDQQENRIAAALSEIGSILIPARYQGSIYINDESGAFYEFNLSRQELSHGLDPGELLDSIPANSYVKYYPLFSYAGNETLLPLTHQINKPLLFVESEVDASSNEQMNQWAGQFFNENFDFVKTIQETSGTRIYMYGYGQQEVRINNRGRLEYSAETGSQTTSSVVKALDTALLFLADNDGLNSDLVLREVRLLEQDNLRGYQFGFGYNLRDVPVALARSQQPLEIEVFGNNVRSYRAFIRRPMSLPEVLPESGIISPHRLIEDNFNQLLQELAEERTQTTTVPVSVEPAADIEEANTSEVQEPESPETAGEDLLRAIREIELIYLDREETHRRQLMIPVWRITIDQRIYDFDAHEGTRLQTLTLSGREV
jgi:hypothetical protein